MTTTTAKDQVKDERKLPVIMIDPKVFALGLTPTEFTVYAALLSFAGNTTSQCWPSKDKLAKRAGVSKRSVDSAIDSLKSKKLIDVSDGENTRSNLYTIKNVVRRKRVQNLHGKGAKSAPTDSAKSAPELESIRTQINELKETPPPTPATPEPEPSQPGGANGAAAGEKELTPIETLLAENGVNVSSWKHAADWTLEQLQVIVDRAKEPGVKNPPAYIVSQLQKPSARSAVQLELDTRKDAPAVEVLANELADLASQEYAPVERKPAIPPFEPIIDGWKKSVSAPDTWQHGVLPALAGQFHRATYNSWIAGSQVVAYEGQEKPPVLTVVATSDYARDWLKQRMIKTVLELAKQHFGEIAIQVIAPSEVNERLYASRVRIESKPNPTQFFSKGIGWIGRDGDEQHEGSAEPEPQPIEPTGQDGNQPTKPDPATLSPASVWSKIYGGLRFNDLTAHQFETYVKPSRLYGYLENTIFVVVSDHARSELQKNLHDKLSARIAKAAGDYWQIKFVVQRELDGLPENLIRLQEAV